MLGNERSRIYRSPMRAKTSHVSVTEPASITTASIQHAVLGERRALELLVQALMPIINHRVRRALARHGRAARQSGHDHTDLVQECLLTLFADEGRALRQWEPSRGLSLGNWVGIVVERRIRDVLRRGERAPAASEAGERKREHDAAHAEDLGYRSLEASAELNLVLSKLRETFPIELRFFSKSCGSTTKTLPPSRVASK